MALTSFFNNSGQDAQLTNVQARQGVLLDNAQTSLKVSQRGAGANMSVDVATGIVAIQGTQSATQGIYTACSDAVVNVVITTAHATLARKDIIVARIQDSAVSGVTDSFTIEVVTGTPAGSPVEPAVPANSMKLATVNVAAAAASITNANIVDARVYTSAAGCPIVCTSTTRPLFPVRGQFIYELDTQKYYLYHPNTSYGWTLMGYSNTMNTYVPALTASTTSPTLGTGAIQQAQWGYVDAKVIWVDIKIQFGTASVVAGSGTYRVSVPVNSKTNTNGARQTGITGLVQDSSPLTNYPVVMELGSNASFGTLGGWNVNPSVTNAVPFTWAANDLIAIGGLYGVA